MKHYLTGFAVFVISIFCAWLGGVDFTVRELPSGLFMALAVFLGFFAYSCSRDTEKYGNDLEDRLL